MMALWMPRAGAFFRVPSLPYLGTGKMDLRKIRELALEMSAKETESMAI